MEKKFLFSMIFSLLAFYNFLFACGGNCLDCHKSLKYTQPKEHQIIKKCIICHKNGCGAKEEKYIQKGIEKGLGCGSDCFQCHNIKKVIAKNKIHKKIKQCINCHKL